MAVRNGYFKIPNSNYFISAASILLILVLISSSGTFVNGQYFGLGFCPRVFGMPDFNITKYEGKWYEVEKYFFLPEATLSCVSVEYLDKHDGTFAVEIKQFDNLSRRKWSNPGITKYRGRDGSAEFFLDLTVTQSPVPCKPPSDYLAEDVWGNLLIKFRYPYIVVHTDYTSFTVKYHCQQLGPISMQTMWVLSRSRTFTPETRKAVYKTLRRFGLDTTRLTISDQGSCPP